MAEETIVVLTSDHGDMVGGHGMVWKSTSAFYDEVAQIPLIVRYPKRFEASATSIPASHVDIMPTLLDLTGQVVPKQVQGQSLVPYLAGERDPEEARAYAFTERVVANPEETRKVSSENSGSFMLRGRGWKYVRYADGREYLYDLKRDPHEKQDLSEASDYADRKKMLAGELDSWLQQSGYPGV